MALQQSFLYRASGVETQQQRYRLSPTHRSFGQSSEIKTIEIKTFKVETFKPSRTLESLLGWVLPAAILGRFG